VDYVVHIVFSIYFPYTVVITIENSHSHFCRHFAFINISKCNHIKVFQTNIAGRMYKQQFKETLNFNYI